MTKRREIDKINKEKEKEKEKLEQWELFCLEKVLNCEVDIPTFEECKW